MSILRIASFSSFLLLTSLHAQSAHDEHGHAHDKAPSAPLCNCANCPTHGDLVKAAEALHHSPATPAAEIRYLQPEVMAQYALFDHLDVFNLPAGPKGFEYSDKTKSLAGKKVRITGYMVRHMAPDANRFMFADRPVVTIEHEYGIVDDVPPNVIHVFIECDEGMGATWLPAPITVYGTLEIGSRKEADGRTSFARIQADYITVGTDHVIISVCQPLDVRPLFQKPHHHDGEDGHDEAGHEGHNH